MAFTIEFLKEPIPDNWLLPGEDGILARITIGDFDEKETILTNYWSRIEYINQWIEACSRIIDGNDGIKSAIATAVHDPSDPKHGYVIAWWPLYKVGDKVYIRNGSVPFVEKGSPVDLNNLYEYVADRIVTDENPPSEWEITLNELKIFKEELTKQR